ncbi:adhesion G-protein coupled receptor G7-like [Heterodontus francisci]|uniref:adhesion G-protein coupled receptor G7-like n=1 Tax=Heterodontus francisci TaxID=7792 RepID=UPI00355C058F
MKDHTGLNQTSSKDAVRAFCQLLEVKPDIINKVQQSLSRLTKDLENMTVAFDLNEVCPQVAVRSNQVNSTAGSSGLGLVSYQSKTYMNKSHNNKMNILTENCDINVAEMEACIYIPNNSFGPDARFGFVLYKDASFFPVPKNKDSFVLKTQVISGSVSEHPSDLKDSVTITFKNKIINDEFEVKGLECAYWNYTVGQWLTNGLNNGSLNETATHFTCQSDHLTSFAVLMTFQPNSLQYLDTISYIGCALSILGLLATIIAPMRMKDYRRSVNGKLQINLSVALLGVYITFLSGAISSDWKNATPENEVSKEKNPFCSGATWFLHFFLLASFAWMCVQGIALYSSYSRIIQQMERSYFAAVSAGVAWGAPALIAIITIAVTEPKNTYRQKKICWLSAGNGTTTAEIFSGKNVLLWAFLFPVSLMLLLNMVIFGLIMSMMVCNKKNLKAYKGDFKKSLQRHFATIFANTVTLGMCWVTGYFMLIEKAYAVFSTIFCILNSLQGLFIFILCIMNVKAFQNRMLQPLKVFKKEKRSNISMSSLIIKDN